MTSVNTAASINPFAATGATQATFQYNPSAGASLGYIPMTMGSMGGIDVSQYFGTIPPMPDMTSSLSAYVQNIISNIQLPQINFSAYVPATVSTSAASSSPVAAGNSGSVSSSSQQIADTKSDLKPGLFKGRLAGQEALVSRLCHKYGVSPALVASIIGLESGWGTSNLAMHNNFGGYRAAGDLGKNEKGFGYFSTIEKGLEAMIKNLAGYTRYSDVSQVNFNNLDNIGRHYCEGGVWSSRVREMYNSRVSSYLA